MLHQQNQTLPQGRNSLRKDRAQLSLDGQPRRSYGLVATWSECQQALVNINPADPVEGMLAVQIIAAHETALSLRRRAWQPEQSFVVQTRFLELADKAARTLAVLIENS